MTSTASIMIVAGARPNFIKVAPIMWELSKRPGLKGFLVNTGQHYDAKMAGTFFEQLRIPAPDVNLEVGSGSHAVQTAEIMKRFEPVLLEHRPDAVIVVGDVNSTVACAITAVKLGIPVAHVEAGLRSLDRSMPEEINRLLTDAISDWHFVSERSGVDHLLREGTAPSRIHFVGNVMIDTLVACRQRFDRISPASVGMKADRFAVLTLHRPSNVDDPATLKRLLDVIEKIQSDIAIAFPVHPRTKKALEALAPKLPNVTFMEPLGYLEFMALVARSQFVLTDSGGIQEEATYLGIPCITLRKNTERPCTITDGTNVLVGDDGEAILSAARKATEKNKSSERRLPELWDGNAAKRILDVLENEIRAKR